MHLASAQQATGAARAYVQEPHAASDAPACFPMEVPADPTLPADPELQRRAAQVAARYDRENRLLDAVMHGNYPAAEEALRQIARTTGRLRRNPDDARDRRNALIVTNTLLRKTVESARIHPYHIDSISSRWGVRIERAEEAELPGLMLEILRDYTRFVRDHELAGYSPNVRAALDHIRLHLPHEKLSLATMAEALHISPSYLCTQFRKEVGMGVPEYAARVRIDRAQQLLAADHKGSIASVARAVGFASPTYFSRRFRELVGCTPTEYRLRMRENPSADDEQPRATDASAAPLISTP